MWFPLSNQCFKFSQWSSAVKGGRDSGSNAGTSSTLFMNGGVIRLSVIPVLPYLGQEIDGTSTTLWWYGGTDDWANLKYDVYLDTNSNPTTLVSANQTGISYASTGLQKATKYYYKIVVKDSRGSVTSSIMNFTVAMSPEWSYDTDYDVNVVEVSADGEYIVAGNSNSWVYLFEKDSSNRKLEIPGKWIHYERRHFS